jgi:hypothetical protein
MDIENKIRCQKSASTKASAFLGVFIVADRVMGAA